MPLQNLLITLGYKYDGVGMMQPESQSSNYMDLYKYGNVDQCRGTRPSPNPTFRTNYFKLL